MFNSSDTRTEFDLETWKSFLENAARDDPIWFKYFSVPVLFIIFITGLFGNVLTCVVIYYDKHMHTTTNFYLFDMAISDLIVSFGIFLEIYMFVTDTYTMGNLACKLNTFFYLVLWNNSIIVMTILAIERYKAVMHPLLSKPVPSLRKVMRVIICTWIIAILVTLPELVTTELVTTEKVSFCFTVPTTRARIISGVLAVVTYIIPLTIMLFVYIMIALKVNISEKINAKKKIFNHKDNRRKINKLVVAITFSFFICWLPCFWNRLLFFFCDMNRLIQLGHVWEGIYNTCLITNWFSITLNPLLFSLMSSKFRKAFKMLWKTKLKRQTEIVST